MGYYIGQKLKHIKEIRKGLVIQITKISNSSFFITGIVIKGDKNGVYKIGDKTMLTEEILDRNFKDISNNNIKKL